MFSLGAYHFHVISVSGLFVDTIIERNGAPRFFAYLSRAFLDRKITAPYRIFRTSKTHFRNRYLSGRWYKRRIFTSKMTAPARNKHAHKLPARTQTPTRPIQHNMQDVAKDNTSIPFTMFLSMALGPVRA